MYKEHSITQVKNAETGELETMVSVTAVLVPKDARVLLSSLKAPKSALVEIDGLIGDLDAPEYTGVAKTKPAPKTDK